MRLLVHLLKVMALAGVLTTSSVHAQITAAGALSTGSTSYLPSDPVYLLSPLQNAVLQYQTNDPEANFTFQWTRHNPSDNSWTQVLQMQTGNSASILVSDAGGYQLRVTRAPGDEVVFRCWVYEPVLMDATIDVLYEDCFKLNLLVKNDSLPLAYYDPVSGSQGFVNYNRTYQWRTTPVSSVGTGAFVDIDAPVENTQFEVTVRDRVGSLANAVLNYTALAVKADYKADVVKAEVLHEVHSSAEGSAPIEIRFQDQSKGNITGWSWQFGRFGRAVERNPFYVFTSFGTDTVNLTVINDFSGCVHQMESPLVVNVMESMLEIPNTFTPNGDGVNDEFRVVYRSLRKFNMLIYNRWGRKVFESSNPAEGWDGTVGGSMGAPGVYFYYIEAEGYQPNEKYRRQGPIHLIRGK